MSAIGKFPSRLKPVTYRSQLTNIDDFIDIKELYEKLTLLNMCLYNPFEYILPEKSIFMEKYTILRLAKT